MRTAVAKQSRKRVEKIRQESVQGLMEGIILQCMEDLYVDSEEEDCKKFFKGEGFGICADVAGMNLYDQVRVLNFANKIIRH